MKLKIRRVKNIFRINKTLTSHLKISWRIEKPTWYTPKHFWWTVTYKGEWVGYAGARIHDEETLYIGPTYIKNEYRGKGLQKRLIMARIRFAKKNGFKKLISSTNWDNYWSSNNLIKCGFFLIKAWDNINEVGLYWTLIL